MVLVEQAEKLWSLNVGCQARCFPVGVLELDTDDNASLSSLI
jgi:hypothetical protein